MQGCTAVITCLLLSLSIIPAASQLKNVLLIIADDFRPNIGSLGESGHFSSPPMVTPHLDSLAARSLVLTNAFSQVALCGPSRSSFMTGRRPDTIRCYDNSHSKSLRERLPELVRMPQYFKEAGYLSLGAGKVYHPGMPDTNKQDDFPWSWSEEIHHTPTTDDKSKIWHAYSEEELEGVVLRDVANTDYFVSKLQEISGEAQSGEQPFFFALGYHKPHMPWDAPQQFYDLYPEADMDLPLNPYIPDDMPLSAWSSFSGVRRFPDCSAEGTGIPDIGEPNITYSESKVREMRRAYYATVSFMDHQVGRVLAAVEESGLADSTVIMFIGDHGLHMGEQAEWAKYTSYEIAHRAPMMLHVPGVIDQSVFSESLVEFVDIFPTLVEAAGLPHLEKCPENSRNVSVCREGMSFLRIVQDQSESEWKDAVFWQQPRGYSANKTQNYQGYTVRTGQYRYSEYVNLIDDGLETQQPDWNSPEDWGELYDLSVDPLETKNLYRREGWEEVRDKLSQTLREGWSQHNH